MQIDGRRLCNPILLDEVVIEFDADPRPLRRTNTTAICFDLIKDTKWFCQQGSWNRFGVVSYSSIGSNWCTRRGCRVSQTPGAYLRRLDRRIHDMALSLVVARIRFERLSATWRSLSRPRVQPDIGNSPIAPWRRAETGRLRRPSDSHRHRIERLSRQDRLRQHHGIPSGVISTTRDHQVVLSSDRQRSHTFAVQTPLAQDLTVA